MTAEALTASWRTFYLPLFGPAGFVLSMFGAAAWLGWISWPAPSSAERRLCDQAVDALLHSKDLVEVQRAGIIVREIPCGIGRRLTDEGK